MNQLEAHMNALAKGLLANGIADGSGLTPALSKVLFIIGIHRGCNVKQIAHFLQITSGAATQHIGLLEADGLCRRVTNPADRRESMVELTPAGEQQFQSLQDCRRRILETIFFGLDDTELQTFVQLFSKVKP